MSVWILICVLLLLLLLYSLPKPKPPILTETLHRIQDYGLDFDITLTDKLENPLESSNKSESRKAWFQGFNLSLKYFRSVYLDSVLETVDLIFTDKHGAGGLILHYVDGKPVKEERPGKLCTPLQNTGHEFNAYQILKEVQQAHEKQARLIGQ